MFENLLPILAVKENWIYFIVVGIAIVVSIIGNIVKEAKQRQEQRERRSATRPPAGGERPGQTTSSRLDEMAERRRRQLQELAQRRRSGESRSLPGTGPAVSNDPMNLTAAQLAERERARAAYERRAAQLRGQRAHQANPPQGAAGPRRKPKRLHSSIEQRHLPPPATPLADRPRLAPDPGSHNLGSNISTFDAVHSGETDQPSRHVPDVSMEAPLRKSSPIAKLIAQHHVLRNAVVLKEILDRPIALREDQERC